MSKPSLSKILFLLPILGFLIFTIIAAVALYGTLSGTRKVEQLPSVLIGKVAPALPSVPLTEALAIPLEAYRGQPVLINFMASWCAPCRAELPTLALLGEDVVVIAIAYKDKKADTLEFLDTYGNPYQAVWMDYDGAVGMSYGLYGVPETFLLDGDGRVVLRHAGPVFRGTLSDIIRPALKRLSTQTAPKDK